MASTQKTQSTDWFQAQQQYWDQWFKTQRETVEEQVKNASKTQGQWADFFQQWQNTVAPGKGIPNASAYQNFFTNAGQQFLNMMQQFQTMTGQEKTAVDAATEWTESLQKFFGSMLQANTQPFDLTAAYKNFTTFGENMTKAAGNRASALQQGGPFAQGWNMDANHGMPDLSKFDPLGFFASIPGIGYAREKQDAANKLYKLWAQYETMNREYNAAMANIGLEAVTKFQEYLANPPKDKEPITSLKGIYAKWVDVCEDVYAKFAMSDEYTKLYGEVVNALMAYKKQMNLLVDENLEQFNLPNRTEVDALHKALHELKRENRELRKDLDALKKPGAAKSSAAKTTKKGKK